MIRILLTLTLIITVFIGLVVFPEISNQPVRIEMLGWLFETRTGMFILLILLILGTLWFVQKAFELSVNSPKQLWANLSSGSRKRREQHLQDALKIWIDEGEGNSQKLLKRSKGVVPDWLYESLLTWWDAPASHGKINDEKDTPLSIALKARLATDEEHAAKLSISERQQYLDTWLAVHPGASLALQRKAEILGELHEYAEQVTVLESLWSNRKNALAIKPLLTTALVNIAKQDSTNKLTHLRKANRINPADTDALTALAIALVESGDKQSGIRLLLEYLERHDDWHVAEVALSILSSDPLKHFKSVDKSNFQKTLAGNWLRVSLAHKADLTGIAEEGLNSLLEHHPSAQLWQVRGDWYSDKKQWEKAASAYQKAEHLRKA